MPRQQHSAWLHIDVVNLLSATKINGDDKPVDDYEYRAFIPENGSYAGVGWTGRFGGTN